MRCSGVSWPKTVSAQLNGLDVGVWGAEGVVDDAVESLGEGVVGGPAGVPLQPAMPPASTAVRRAAPAGRLTAYEGLRIDRR